MEDDRLSVDDARILALESAAIAGHTLKLVVLEPGAERLDLDALRESVEARLPAGLEGALPGRAGPGAALGSRRAVLDRRSRRPRARRRGHRRARPLGAGRGADVGAARPRPAAVALRRRRAARRRARGDRLPDPPRDGRRDQLGALPARGALGGGAGADAEAAAGGPGPGGQAFAARRGGAAAGGADARARPPRERHGPRPADRLGARGRLRRLPARRAEGDRRLASRPRDRQRRLPRRGSPAACAAGSSTPASGCRGCGPRSPSASTTATRATSSATATRF